MSPGAAHRRAAAFEEHVLMHQHPAKRAGVDRTTYGLNLNHALGCDATKNSAP
jgi:hypothetical protein